MLRARLITAAILLVLLLSGIWLLPQLYFALVVLLVLVLGAWEWGGLVRPQSIGLRLCSVALLLLFALLVHLKYLSVWAIALAVPLWVLICAWVILFQRDISLFLHWQWLRFVLGPLLLGITFLSLYFLRQHSSGPAWISLIFLLIFATDTGAYFVGSYMGRHKLIHKVSPNKTIEGLIGGVVLAVGVSMVVTFFWPQAAQHRWLFMLLALLVSLVAVLGDLFESMLKRMVGVKDSGNLLPGHGGILDRIDSVLSALPVACLFIFYFFGVT